jgi:hypothetical protein
VFVQSYRMRNSFLNPVYVGAYLLVVMSIYYMIRRSSCPQDLIRKFSVKCLLL